MVENTLDKIINKKTKKINQLKKIISIESLKEKIQENNKFANFKKKIEINIANNKISIIAEIKKSSPSAGIIVKDYNPVDIAKKYHKNKATCLSILTEEDFFIDPFQSHLARSYGADAILIILAAVNDKTANQLYENALKLNMSVIVEVHTKEEAKNSIKFKDALIGINNRNLKTLKTDINTTFDIHEVLINHKGPLISESGIQTKDELLEIAKKTRIQTFLIGESLLKNSNNNSIFSVL